MRLAGRRVLSVVAFALLALAFAGCENPLDPIDKSERIKGLSYVDFALTWERWDSDPAYDGVEIAMSYYNEFGETLSFHDKPHEIVIEFYTQKLAGADPASTDLTYDQLFFTKSVTFRNADDTIRIPWEAYWGAMQGAGLDLTVSPVKAFVMVHVFPPQDEPRHEVKIGYSDMDIYKLPVTPEEPVP